MSQTIHKDDEAILLDGVATNKKIIAKIKAEVDGLRKKKDVVPGLATILLGDNPASMSYVRLKIKTAKECGFYEVQKNLNADATQTELLDLIKTYNQDERIHGLLVQLPLPAHIDEEKIVLAIDPRKDVDGFHPVNLGHLLMGSDEKGFVPCTPAGIVRLLEEYKISVTGKHVVIIGRSNLVGKPLANLLLQKSRREEVTNRYRNATVTIVHTGTTDMKHFTKQADILVAAAGWLGLVKKDWIKSGAVVIDVGVNFAGTVYSKKLQREVSLLKGDVDFDDVKELASYITPVPGGVGPMTIACLMENTLIAYKGKYAYRL